MTYNVFSGTLNPTHSLATMSKRVPINLLTYLLIILLPIALQNTDFSKIFDLEIQ